MALAKQNHGTSRPPGSPDPFLQSCFPAIWSQPVLLLRVIPFQGQDLVFAFEFPALLMGCFSSPSQSLWVAALPSSMPTAPCYLVSSENELRGQPVPNSSAYLQFGHLNTTGDSVKGLAKVKLYSLHCSALVHGANRLTLAGDQVHWP